MAKLTTLSFDYELDGFRFRTLPRPGGERLATFATVNDVHFGETECGVIEGLEIGPIFTAEPGEPPYPDTMNGAAIEEIAAIDPDRVLVKGEPDEELPSPVPGFDSDDDDEFPPDSLLSAFLRDSDG